MSLDVSSLSSTDRAAWAVALDSLALDGQSDRWRADPVVWVQERLGEHVWSKQAEIMRSVHANKLTAVQSCHGVGKSHIMSRLVAYYLDVYEPGEFFIVTTAPTWAQVRAVLWRYIGQTHRAGGLRGVVSQNAEWKIDGELVAYGRKPADHDAAAFQGVRGHTGVVVVLDEACGVPSQLWDAADSMATTDASRIVAVGNPDTMSSRFYRVCTTEPGWNRIQISASSSPNFTDEPVPADVARQLVSREWVADKALRWGVRSPLYRIKVDGEFADDDANSLIPMSWVLQAHQRWHAWNENLARDTAQPYGRRVFGVDVGHSGEDKTCIATRQGDVVMSVESWSQLDTVAVTRLVEARLDATPQSTSVVDAIGVGAGVVDLLRAHGKNVQPFVASRATKRRDATGTQGFNLLRSAAWWHLRELLDPALGATLALPPDDDLTADLTTPRWTPVTGGKIVVESKDDIRKRLGRSTDAGDAVVQSVWVEATQSEPRLPGVGTGRARPYANSVGGWT